MKGNDKLINFTYNCYKSILIQMKKINKINNFKSINYSIKNGFILRHDVDFNLEKAYIMSNIEKEIGVISTYFVLITSDLYNICSCTSKYIINEIIKNGSEIGLHFDPTAYGDISLKEMQQQVKNESRIVEDITGNKIESISLHNPSIHNQYPEFEGYKNAYSKEFFNPDLYISDSCKDFREKDVFEFIKNGKNNLLQVLFHPMHFSENEETYIESFSKIIESKINSFDEYMHINKTYKKEIKKDTLLNSFINYVKGEHKYYE